MRKKRIFFVDDNQHRFEAFYDQLEATFGDEFEIDAAEDLLVVEQELNADDPIDVIVADLIMNGPMPERFKKTRRSLGYGAETPYQGLVLLKWFQDERPDVPRFLQTRLTNQVPEVKGLAYEGPFDTFDVLQDQGKALIAAIREALAEGEGK